MTGLKVSIDTVFIFKQLFKNNKLLAIGDHPGTPKKRAASD